ncbi:MAG: HlyD family secretion protein [Arcobacter sp.]|nr:HlyD family secretion protein [Arcobacter sp.]
MKYLFTLLFFVSVSLAGEFYSKLEPINSFLVKSSVSGKVIYTNDKLEGLKANNSKIVEIDSFVNRIDLQQSTNKLKAINSMIKIEQNNYKRLKRISSKSAFEKDNQKIKVINLESSKADILIKIANLKDSIKNKKMIEKSNYIYNIAVKKGEYVNPGTLLYEAKDLSKGKLEIFIPISDVNKIKDKIIYLDGKRTDLKINKIFNVADSKHISSYKVNIIIDNPKIFSRLVKIEFK